MKMIYQGARVSEDFLSVLKVEHVNAFFREAAYSDNCCDERVYHSEGYGVALKIEKYDREKNPMIITLYGNLEKRLKVEEIILKEINLVTTSK